MTGQEAFEAWFHRVWTEEDSSAIDELFPGDGEARGLGSQTLVGPDDFKQFQAALTSLVSDIVIEVDKALEDGEWVACMCVFRGTHRDTGEAVSMTGSVYGRTEGATILEAYNHWDFMTLFEQLGLLPDGTFATCLGGQRVA